MDDIDFQIFRFDSEREEAPRFETFRVPYRPGLTVLDGLLYIQEGLDGSLAFRASCREAVCGSCAMHINGKYRLACNTQISELNSDTVTVRPMAHLPVLKDLVVDMEIFWEKYNDIKPYLMPGEPPPEVERTQSPDERAQIDSLIDCILCAACYASCPVVGADDSYLGPAAITKANRFLQDSRDKADGERLRIVEDDTGVFRCHTIFNCLEVCPKYIDPSASIAAMKMGITKSKARKLKFW